MALEGTADAWISPPSSFLLSSFAPLPRRRFERDAEGYSHDSAVRTVRATRYILGVAHRTASWGSSRQAWDPERARNRRIRCCRTFRLRTPPGYGSDVDLLRGVQNRKLLLFPALFLAVPRRPRNCSSSYSLSTGGPCPPSFPSSIPIFVCLSYAKRSGRLVISLQRSTCSQDRAGSCRLRSRAEQTLCGAPARWPVPTVSATAVRGLLMVWFLAAGQFCLCETSSCRN